MSFTSPWFLLTLLVVPAALAAAIVIDRRRAKFPVTFTNIGVLASVAPKRGTLWRRYLPLTMLLLALVAASGALARPSMSLSEPDQNATIVLLVDVSGSMRANDVEPTRLDAAVAAMRTFLDRLPKQFKVGLVAFSSEPEPLITPTSDRTELRQSIDLLEAEAGTAVGDGIEVAVKMLKSSLAQAGYVRKPGQALPGAIVLLSDGAQNRGILQPLDAAHNAKVAGIRIYPVSLGTPGGHVSFGFGAFTNLVPVPPDPATMGAIAAATGGKAYTAQSAASVVQIYRTLGSNIGRTHKRVQISSWFALAAAGLLLVAVGAGHVFEARIP
ncbi:MAG TPA: VWA domain-containing protein [Gaiellaceae bacterium]|jgi:Ca-activated chloride channel family protein